MLEVLKHNAAETKISWDCGEASLQSLGAMLGPVTFYLPNGKAVHPLHMAPWEGEDLSDQPPILQRLRGEWPCVPFGMQPQQELPERWQCAIERGAEDLAADHPHGFGSNHHWRVYSPDPLTMVGEIDYPATSAIAGLRRQITATPETAELTIELAITVRSDCSMPIGLHPVFALSDKHGSMRLDPGNYGSVWTHPLDEGPGLSLFHPDRVFSDLSEAPIRDGSTIDACALPYENPSENLLLLSEVSGNAGLINIIDGYRVDLEWDPHTFPSLMLWISNRGRQASPWSGRHLAIGIEPVRAAFDLGQLISAHSNPLNSAGTATARDFVAGEVFQTRYVIKVSKWEQGQTR